MVSNRAERHRRGRPTPAIPVVVDELGAFGEDELWYMLVDYHCSPLGAWTATVAPDGLGPVRLQATSAHDALHCLTLYRPSTGGSVEHHTAATTRRTSGPACAGAARERILAR